MPIIECNQCGKEFYKKPYRLKMSKNHYCCRNCMAIGLRQPNKIILKETYAEIVIEHKNEQIIVLIDIEDINKIEIAKWHAQYDETINNYYIVANERNTTVKNRKMLILHRYIMNCPDNMETDHINRNTLDNRKQNLRNVESIINKRNKGFYNNNKSGYKYIYWKKDKQRWRVEINRKDIKKIVGNYKTKEEAVMNRNKYLKSIMLDAMIDEYVNEQ